MPNDAFKEKLLKNIRELTNTHFYIRMFLKMRKIKKSRILSR